MKSSMVVPCGLAEAEAESWLTGTMEFEAKAGDLWTLAWDGKLLGHVMIASVKAGFILGWPVTLPGEESFAPGMLLKSQLGCDVTVWPTRETGLGLHILERPLGNLLDVAEICRISASLDEGIDPGVRVPSEPIDSKERDESSAGMTRWWTELCFHTGRSDDAMYLDQTKIKALGGSARVVSSLLELDPADVRSYWDAEQELPVHFGELLQSHFKVEIEQITCPSPSSWWWEALASPTYKADIEAACYERQETEMVIRAEVSQSAYALAARQDSDALAGQKLRDAIRRAATKGRE